MTTQDFTFVNWDVKVKGTRPETRRHVNRENNRIAKLRRSGVVNLNLAAKFTGLKGTPTKTRWRLNKQVPQDRSSVSSADYHDGSDDEGTQSGRNYAPSPSNEGRQMVLGSANPVHSPNDLLSSFRREPFDSLPVDLRNDHDLLAYWLDEFPQIMQLAGNPSIEQRWFPKRDVFFSAAMTSSTAFETTILLYALYHRAAVSGYEDPQQFARLRPRLTRWALEATEPSNWTGENLEETAIGIMSFGSAERLYGHAQIGQHFYDRVRQWFRRWRLHTDDWLSSQNVRLKILFWWYKMIGPDIPVYCGGGAPVHHQLEEDFDTFWGFMQDIRELAVRQMVASTGDKRSKRRTFFGQDGRFVSLFQLSPVILPGPKHRRHAYCQFVVLCFTHAGLLELQDSAFGTEAWLRFLDQKLASPLSGDEYPAYSLLWLFQKCPYQTDVARFSQIYASSQIALRLNNTGLSILNRVLMAYLALDEAENWGASLPYLEKSLFRGMVFEPDEWRFVELPETQPPMHMASMQEIRA